MFVKGQKFSEEHRRNISLALKGKAHPWSEKEKIKKECPCGKEFFLTPGRNREKHGKYCSRSCYYKYRDNLFMSKLSKKMKGQTHWNFKGDNALYAALHLRVQAHRGKASICEECGSKDWVEWANISGKYQDVFDYKSLCRKHHNKLDGPGYKRAKTLGSDKLSQISYKGWLTRKTSLEASMIPQESTEGGVFRE